MQTSFTPPGITSLTEIDQPQIAYEDECALIDGVISPSDPWGLAGKTSDYDVHRLEFTAWRRQGGPIVNRELTILRPIPPKAHERWFDFPKYSVQRFSVLMSVDGTRAVFDKALTLDAVDSELLHISAKLQEPVVIQTKTFGDLVLNRGIGWFEGKAAWNGKTIRVIFPVDAQGSIDNALKAAESLWSAQAAWKKRVDDFAVQRLLGAKNDTWLKWHQFKFSAKKFLAHMTLTSISITSEGCFDFWHDDGDLFWGHAIQISGNLKDGPTRADTPG